MKITCPCCNKEITISILAISGNNTKNEVPELSFTGETMRAIERIVCSVFDVSVEELKSNSRKTNIVIARQTFMYLCSRYADNVISLTIIAKRMNRQDHTIAIHSREVISELIEIYERRKLDKLKWKYILIKKADEQVQEYFVNQEQLRNAV